MVKVSSDSADLHRDLLKNAEEVKAFTRTVQTELKGLTNVRGNVGAMNQYATDLLAGLKSTFATQSAATSEALARGLLTPEQARAAGDRSAIGFNAGLLAGIDKLRGQGAFALQPEFEQELIGQLQRVGTRAGDAFRQNLSTAARLRAGDFTVGKDISAFGDGMLRQGALLTAGITLPIIGAGAALTHFGAQADLAQGKMQLLARTGAPAMAAEIERLRRIIPATTAELTNLTVQTSTAITALGVAPKPAQEMSLALAKVAGNLAIIRGRPVEEALNAVRAGLLGNLRPLKDFDVILSKNIVTREALHAGLVKNKSDMTTAAQAQATYNLIMREGALQEGAAEQMRNRAAVQLQFTAAAAREAAANLGKQLLPALVSVLQAITPIVERIGQLNPETIRMALYFAALAAAAGPLVTAVGAVIKIFGGLVTVIGTITETTLFAGLAAALTPAGAVIVGLTAVAGLVYLISTHMKQGQKDLDDYTKSLSGFSREMLNTQQTSLGNQLRDINAQVDAAQRKLDAAQRAGGASPDLGSVINTNSAEKNLNRLKTIQTELRSKFDITTNAITAQGEAARKAAADDASFAERLRAIIEAGNEPLNGGLTTGKSPEQKRLDELRKQVEGVNRLQTLANEGAIESVGLISRELELHARVTEELSKQKDQRSDQAVELLEMLGTLNKIAGVQAALGKDIIQPRVVAINTPLMQPTTPAPIISQAVLQGGTGLLAYLKDLVSKPFVDLATSSNVANHALYDIKQGTSAFLSGLKNAGLSALKALNPLNIFGSAFDQLIRNLAPVFTSLEKPLALVAKMVNDVVAPVFEALAPVIEALIPPIRAILQVLVPILVALTPVFNAVAIILEAFFPIIKAAAIALTYFAQSVLITAGIFAKAIGFVIAGFGEIVKAIAKAVDALPGISAKGAIRAAQGIINFGHSLEKAGNEFFSSAADMADARKKIEAVSIDHTATALDGLGDAADSVTKALKNIPDAFRVAAAIFNAQDAAARPVGAPGSAANPLQSAPNPDLSSGITQIFVFKEGAVPVDARNMDPRDILNKVTLAAKQKASATTGRTTDAAAMLGF